MNQLRKFWERFFPPIEPLKPGVYHFQAPADAPLPYRLHLRVEPDGYGILIVNASTVLHLNATATEYAYHLVQNTPEDEAISEIGRRYNVRKEIVRRDFFDLQDRLHTLIDTPDLDPVTFLDFERQDPYTGARSAPYRVDCALTYHLPDQSPRGLAPVDRAARELVSEEWETILEKAWQAGVPHVVFTGGEPTIRPDLCRLIGYAEKLGMVSGLITDGLRLSEKKYLHELLQSGLDHVMVLLDPGEEQCWEALRDTMAEDIAVTVHLTLTERELARFDDTLAHLAEMGVQNISLSVETPELKDQLQACRQAVAERQMHLVWDLPVPYSHFHPVAVELAEEHEGANPSEFGPGHAWIYIEPDGDVLTGQGRYQTVLGNMLVDPWEHVWGNARKDTAQPTAA